MKSHLAKRPLKRLVIFLGRCKMLKWIKEKLGISALEAENKILRAQLQYHREFVSQKINELKDYTRVDADLGYRGNNTIILTGVYRRRAFVQFYDVGEGEFQRAVDMLRNMKEHALVRHIDKVPSFHGTFEI
ncbi:hypothetical protein ACOHYD_11790 [Desulfobacterota bacterium M19]